MVPEHPLAGAPHVPVLLTEVLATLSPRDDGLYVDGTFGAGSYSRAILDAAQCTVFSIDRDPAAMRRAEALGGKYGARLQFLAGCFGEMDTLLGAHGIEGIDGIALDLGVSSMQLDEAERGFSFLHDGPLDMRMSQVGDSAADVVNTLAEKPLADILFSYGEERRSRTIARAIVAARREAPITRTSRLASIVAKAAPSGAQAIHPATRTFQALRIYVNRELQELASGLGAAERLLRPGGRLAVVSFHSLEDRIVKLFLKQRTGPSPQGSRHFPTPTPTRNNGPSFRPLDRGVRTPSQAEIQRNPRARSARLRSAERTSSPPIPVDMAKLGVPVPAALRERGGA